MNESQDRPEWDHDNYTQIILKKDSPWLQKANAEQLGKAIQTMLVKGPVMVVRDEKS